MSLTVRRDDRHSEPPNMIVPTVGYHSHVVLHLEKQSLVTCAIVNTMLPKSNTNPKPWIIVFLQRNYLERLDGLVTGGCMNNLIKLDLSYNKIRRLPNERFWKQLPQLQILQLNNNQIDSIHELKHLSCIKNLKILTLYDNPVEHHPAYRHLLVNSNLNLKLLDFYIVSDEELIEGSSLGPKYGAFSKNHELQMGDYGSLSEEEEIKVLDYELKLATSRHCKLSPVLTIQRYYRGYLVRRTMRTYSTSAFMIQATWRRYYCKKIERMNDIRYKYGFQSSRVLYVLDSTELAVSLFKQIIIKLQNKISYRVNDCNMNLSKFIMIRDNNKNDNIIVRSINNNNNTTNTTNLGCFLLVNNRPRIKTRITTSANIFSSSSSSSSSKKYKHFFKFESPSNKFHEALCFEIRLYNEALIANNNVKKIKHRYIHIYPSTIIARIAAAVSIQSFYRSYLSRRNMRPSLGVMLCERRANRCLVRWFKNCIFRKRMCLLEGIVRYGNSINDNELYITRDMMRRILRNNIFVTKLKLFPEYNNIVDVNDYIGLDVDMVRQQYKDYQNDYYINNAQPQDVIYNLSAYIHELVKKRPYPYPLWLSNYFEHSIPIEPDTITHHNKTLHHSIPLSLRLARILCIGVKHEQVKDVNSFINKKNKIYNQNNNENEKQYIRLVFSSVQEARIRAISLLLYTYDTVDTSNSICILSENSHILAKPHDEDLSSYMYNLYWLKPMQENKRNDNNYARKIPKGNLLNPEVYNNLFQVQHHNNIIETTNTITLPEAISTSTRNNQYKKPHPPVCNYDVTQGMKGERKYISPVDGYDRAFELYTSKKQIAESVRLTSRRLLAEQRLIEKETYLVSKQRNRTADMRHVAKMQYWEMKQQEETNRRIHESRISKQEAALAKDEVIRKNQLQFRQLNKESKDSMKKMEQDRAEYQHKIRLDSKKSKHYIRERIDYNNKLDKEKAFQAQQQYKKQRARLRYARIDRENTIAFSGQKNMMERHLRIGLQHKKTIEEALIKHDKVHQLKDNKNIIKSRIMKMKKQRHEYIRERREEEKNKLRKIATERRKLVKNYFDINKTHRHQQDNIKNLAMQARLTFQAEYDDTVKLLQSARKYNNDNNFKYLNNTRPMSTGDVSRVPNGSNQYNNDNDVDDMELKAQLDVLSELAHQIQENYENKI